MIKKILINATNLNEGGGLQVATSFLKDLNQLDLSSQLEISVYVSSVVDENLETEFFDRSYFFEYKVKHRKEINLLNSYKLNQFDVVFTVFGPFFLPLYRKKHICGFAQPWVIYSSEDVLRKFNFLNRFFLKLKYFLAAFIFRKADVLVVESIHIKELLIKKGFANQIEVVENAVSSVFFNKDEWQEINSDIFDSKKINIGILSGSYPHKNLDFIVKLAINLENNYPNIFNFIFTIRPDKFEELMHKVQNCSLHNLGPIKIYQCPDFYRKIDAIILPSLLECFSITPYEAMLMKKVVFLSDRDFFKKNCFSYAKYFDPLVVNSAVDLIENWFFIADNIERVRQVDYAYYYAKKQINSVEKSKRYIQIMRNT